MDAVELPAETITSEVIRTCATPISEDHDDKFGVPSLEELGKFVLYLEVSAPCVHEYTGRGVYTQMLSSIYLSVTDFSLEVLNLCLNILLFQVLRQRA